MQKKNFLILEELKNLPSDFDLLKSIAKYAPRSLATEFLQFIKQVIETIPQNFYRKNFVTVCSTNNLAYIKFFKEKFTNATWSKKEMVVSLYKRKACATIHYYIENNNLVVLVYTNDFYLKQQALPYASVK